MAGILRNTGYRAFKQIVQINTYKRFCPNAVYNILATSFSKKAEWKNSNDIVTQLPKSIDGSQDEDDLHLIPLEYIKSLTARTWFKTMAYDCNYWLNVPEDKLDKISAIVTNIQLAGVILDDIMDGSEYRKGKPAAHIIFGIPFTTNSVGYSIVVALQKLVELDKPIVLEMFAQQMLDAYKGQGLEIYYRDTFQCPTEDIYLQKIMKKTTAPLQLTFQLLNEFSETKTNLSKFAHLIGTYFEIYNDYEDFFKIQHKSICEDMTEGKYAFPVIHAVNREPENGEIQSILKLRTGEMDVKMRFVSLLTKYGSLTYTRKTLKMLELDIMDEIQKLGGNPQLELRLSLFFSSCRHLTDLACQK